MLRRLRACAWGLGLVAAVVVLAWLSHGYERIYDWSAGQRNTLTAASRELLQQLDGGVRITAFVEENRELRRAIAGLVERYQRVKPDIVLAFAAVDDDPAAARAFDIQSGGDLVVEYAGRHEKLKAATEQGLTNALLRLAGSGERWVVFVEGHGERSTRRSGNHDLRLFAERLGERDVQVQTLDLGHTPVIPDNTSVLVIAGPQTPFSEGEAAVVGGYLERGGSLLWLADPDSADRLAPVADRLGIRFLPGVVLSTRSLALGFRSPSLIVVNEYGDHPLTRSLVHATVFPVAAALEPAPAGWQAEPILTTGRQSWTETADLDQPPLQFDADTDERAGPLTLAVALTREIAADGAARQQRVAVFGDGDFLSDAFLGNGANEALGMNLIHWLSHDDRFIAIPPWAPADLHLTVSPAGMQLVRFGFPFVVPALLIGIGWTIRVRRRRAASEKAG